MIRMEHLNHHANLYAGRGIEWMVESAFMASCLTHGDKNGLFYKNMHRFDFKRSVEPGDIVRYESTVVRAGRTSLTVHVDLKNEQTGDLYASGYATFVTIDPASKAPKPHGIVLDETDDEDEKTWRREAETFF